jgi:hypothetical protein
MAVTYTWKIVSLKKTNGASLSDVIVSTSWQCEGTDENGNTGIFNGATPFELASVDSENFVSYENLTEEIVVGWIKSVVVDTYLNHVQEQILRQIDMKKNPVVEVSNLPWNPPPAPVTTTET